MQAVGIGDSVIIAPGTNHDGGEVLVTRENIELIRTGIREFNFRVVVEIFDYSTGYDSLVNADV